MVIYDQKAVLDVEKRPFHTNVDSPDLLGTFSITHHISSFNCVGIQQRITWYKSVSPFLKSRKDGLRHLGLLCGIDRFITLKAFFRKLSIKHIAVFVGKGSGLSSADNVLGLDAILGRKEFVLTRLMLAPFGRRRRCRQRRWLFLFRGGGRSRLLLLGGLLLGSSRLDSRWHGSLSDNWHDRKQLISD